MDLKVHPQSSKSLHRALGVLKSAGLKKTRARELVLEHLVIHHGPFSAKELHSALKRRELDAVTTYRCLAAFEEVGLVRRCDFGDGIARYEFSEKTGHHHHHVICVDCKKIEVLDHCGLGKLEKQVASLGYTQVRHVLEFLGRCGACR